MSTPQAGSGAGSSEPRRHDLLEGLRPEALDPPESGIVEIFNYGRHRQGLIPLWVGEGDLPTPRFIRDAAARSLADGETFYTYQRGIPELREAIAAYMGRSYGTPFGQNSIPFAPERFYVSVGGMHALQMAVRMVAGSRDEILVPTPAWPNFRGAIMAAGGAVTEVPMRFSGRGGAGNWSLDLDRLADAVTERTRAIVVNSPSNPTGWIATPRDIEALLDLSRRHGLWIIADEIYGRIVYEGDRAPSFHDVIEADDRVLFIQTMSKNWAMTGWRVGWLEAPPELGHLVENLMQYSTSGVPVPLQRGATVALNEGDETVRAQIARARRSRDLLCEALGSSERMHFATPLGAFYLFCRVDGFGDSRELAFRLVDEAGVGVAPGSAFGEGGQGFMRLCFAREPANIAEAGRRLAAWLAG